MRPQSGQPDQLQQQAARLGRLAHNLAVAVPQRAEGRDATGWVRLLLDRDGTPTEIKVRDGWQHRVRPQRLADAVLDANTDAARQALQQWLTAVNDAGWRHGSNVENDAERTSLPTTELPSGHARGSNELAEQATHRLREARTGQTSTPVAEGRDDGEHVTVRLAPGGLVGCTIEPDWAVHRDGVTISSALATALRRAVERRPAPPRGQDSLIGDALANLISLTTPLSDRGDNG